MTRSDDRRARAVLVGRGGEHDDVAAVDAVEVVAELVDHDPVADLEGRLHRARGDGVGGDHERPQQDGDQDGHDARRRRVRRASGRTTAPFRRRCTLGLASVPSTSAPDRVRSCRLRVGVHVRRSMTPVAPAVAHEVPVTPPRQYGPVVSAVIFDFYGTLARFADTDVSNYEAVFAAHGYEPERAVLDDYFSRYNGVEHAEHSVSEEAYEAWVRVRLRDLTAACGVPDPHVEDLVDALRASDQGPMVPYPEAAATLARLARRRARHRRLLELGLGARRVPRPGRAAAPGRRRGHLGPGRRAQAAPRTSTTRRCERSARRPGRRRLRRRLLGARRPRAAASSA